jgi:hypothetical protein
MSNQSVLRAESSEYPPYYGKYIDPIADQDIVALLTTQMGALDALRSLSDADAGRRYAPGKWSVREVIGHVTDSECIFAYRMLRIARGDSAPLQGFDQQPYVDAANFDALPISTLIDGFRTARAGTLAIMRTIEDDAWPRMGTASGLPISARALPFSIAGHATHHFGMLRDTYGISM